MGKHNDAQRAYDAAKAKLARLPKDAKESDYAKANREVIEAGKRLPWHRR